MKKATQMDLLGYPVGEIDAAAAMTSDIVMSPDLTHAEINDYVEIERRTMDAYRGMNRKYTPLMHDSVTGSTLCGGRYVFDTWENAQDYFRWTVEGLEFEPGIKFWNRPIFREVDKHVWKVIGAHDFKPVDTHGVNRFERWSYAAGASDAHAMLHEIWPQLRDAGNRNGLGAAWLLDQPDEKQIAIFMTGCSAMEDSDAAALRGSVDALSLMPSLGQMLPLELVATKLFDRTSPILSTWLPLSRQQGGAPVANPSSPPWPRFSVSPQHVEKPAA